MQALKKQTDEIMLRRQTAPAQKAETSVVAPALKPGQLWPHQHESWDSWDCNKAEAWTAMVTPALKPGQLW